MKMRYRTGDVLFREGDPSEFACLILEGAVEVRRILGDESITLGVLGAGDLVGEMGVLENLPRSATVVAQGDVAVEIIAADNFSDWICASPVIAARLLTRLSSKVRALTGEVLHLRSALRRFEPVAAEHRSANITIAPPSPPEHASPQHASPEHASPEHAPLDYSPPTLVKSAAPPPSPPVKITLRCLGAAGNAVVTVGQPPYRVGRIAPEIGLIESDAQNLVLADHFPYRLSVNHFAVCDDPRLGWIVRDLGSDLGTTVNGQFIGGIFAKDTCRLQPGINTIVAGGLDSPFVFKITVE